MILLGLLACGGGDGSDGAPDPANEGTPTAGAEAPSRHLGLLFVGEVLEFESCAGAVLAVDGPVVPELVSMHGQLVPGVEPMEAIFVDVLGRVVQDDGRATLDAIELRRVAYEGGGCDGVDAGVFFRGSGTEPFWSVEVGEDGLVWRAPETTLRRAHSGLYDGPRGEWMFDALTVDGETAATVSILQTPCVNRMSGAWFHLTMEVEMDGEIFRGCGYLTPDAEMNA